MASIVLRRAVAIGGLLVSSLARSRLSRFSAEVTACSLVSQGSQARFDGVRLRKTREGLLFRWIFSRAIRSTSSCARFSCVSRRNCESHRYGNPD